MKKTLSSEKQKVWNSVGEKMYGFVYKQYYLKKFIQEAQEELKEKIILPRYRKIVDKVFKNKFGDLAK